MFVCVDGNFHVVVRARISGAGRKSRSGILIPARFVEAFDFDILPSCVIYGTMNVTPPHMRGGFLLR